jgi:gluconate 2-dehydrogenase gamma chain
MNDGSIQKSTRRRFLTRTLVVTGATPVVCALANHLGLAFGGAAKATGTGTADGSVEPASGYACLSQDEAGFVETMVNVLCPADRLTPSGVTCGLASYIDRTLASTFGAAAVRHTQNGRETTERQLFKAGVAAANTACERRFGVKLSQLAAASAREFLHGIASGQVRHRDVMLDWWLDQQVYPLLMQACFTGPIYEPYNNRVFWKIFSHSGEPSIYPG